MAEADPLALDCRPADLLCGLEELLGGMRDQGGDRFDAAGWHYIESLARRAAAHEGSARRMLAQKLELAVTSFAARFAQARCAAAELLAASCKQHPHAAAQLQQLFADSDFHGLRHLHARLEARDRCAPLAALVSQLEAVSAGATAHPPTRAAASRVTPAPLELKTVRESRATWARLSVDRQLSLAMKQAPKNAGPINSHMLVLRSLTMMQEFSPDYLSRMVSYVDTLLFLDPGEKEQPVKRKKPVTAKSARPATTRSS